MIYAEVNGKTRSFRSLEDYFQATENGFQNLIADNIGWSTDAATLGVAIGGEEFLSEEDLPPLPEEDELWKPGK